MLELIRPTLDWLDEAIIMMRLWPWPNRIPLYFQSVLGAQPSPQHYWPDRWALAWACAMIQAALELGWGRLLYVEKRTNQFQVHPGLAQAQMRKWLTALCLHSLMCLGMYAIPAKKLIFFFFLLQKSLFFPGHILSRSMILFVQQRGHVIDQWQLLRLSIEIPFLPSFWCSYLESSSFGLFLSMTEKLLWHQRPSADFVLVWSSSDISH